ncbi:MAG TPA: Ig-like domain-containing protein [Gammaproteobacteria bacterium]|nr:Ig-like domain-containing protein [Gammaproteobacteria bacterium]
MISALLASLTSTHLKWGFYMKGNWFLSQLVGLTLLMALGTAQASRYELVHTFAPDPSVSGIYYPWSGFGDAAFAHLSANGKTVVVAGDPSWGYVFTQGADQEHWDNVVLVDFHTFFGKDQEVWGVGVSPDGKAVAFFVADDYALNGHIVIYTETATGWARDAIFTPPADVSGSTFQFTADGDEMVFLAPFSTVDGLTQAGKVLTFKHTPSGWVKTRTLVEPTPVARAQFGAVYSTVMTHDGHLVMNPGDGGGVYTADFNGNDWDTVRPFPDNVYEATGLGLNSFVARLGTDDAIYVHEATGWTLKQTVARPASVLNSTPVVGGAADGSLLVQRNTLSGYDAYFSLIMNSGGTYKVTPFQRKVYEDTRAVAPTPFNNGPLFTIENGEAGPVAVFVRFLQGEQGTIDPTDPNAGCSEDRSLQLFTQENGLWDASRVTLTLTDPSYFKCSRFGAFAVASDDGSALLVTASDANPNEPNPDKPHPTGKAYLYGPALDVTTTLEGPEWISPGDSYTYTLKAQSSEAMNSLGITAAQPTLTFMLPKDVTLGKMTPSTGVSCGLQSIVNGKQTVVCTADKLEKGIDATMSVQVNVTAPPRANSIDTKLTFSADYPVSNDGNGVAALSTYAEDGPPTVQAGAFTVTEGNVYQGKLSGNDPASAPLTFSIVTPPTHGAIKLTDATTGAFTYTPATGFSGTDSFTFMASNGQMDSGIANETATVQPRQTQGSDDDGGGDDGNIGGNGSNGDSDPDPTPDPNPASSTGGGGGTFGGLALIGLAVALRRRLEVTA